MEIKNLIQTNATIITITNLKKGDVVKYIDSDYSSKTLKFGIVTDILNDGTECFIYLTLINKEYGNIKVSYKLLSGKDNVSLFPANKEDIIGEYSNIIEEMEDDLVKQKDQVAKIETNLSFLKSIRNKNIKNNFTTPEFIESNATEVNALNTITSPINDELPF